MQPTNAIRAESNSPWLACTSSGRNHLWLRRGHRQYDALLNNAFGNAIGNSIVDASKPKTESAAELRKKWANTPDNDIHLGVELAPVAPLTEIDLPELALPANWSNLDDLANTVPTLNVAQDLSNNPRGNIRSGSNVSPDTKNSAPSFSDDMKKAQELGVSMDDLYSSGTKGQGAATTSSTGATSRRREYTVADAKRENTAAIGNMVVDTAKAGYNMVARGLVNTARALSYPDPMQVGFDNYDSVRAGVDDIYNRVEDAVTVDYTFKNYGRTAETIAGVASMFLAPETKLGGVGVPATRATNPLSPVLEFDAFGNEIVYRTMSESHFEHLQQTGVLLPTSETGISPTLAYASKYDGVTVKLTTAPGTSAKLQEIGIAANKPAQIQFPTMSTQAKNWMQTSVLFKVEGGKMPQMNTLLGQGKGIDIFNQNLVQFDRVR